MTNGVATSDCIAWYATAPAKPWKFCPECGRKLEADWKHCPGCGQAIGQQAQPQIIPMPDRTYPAWPVYPTGPTFIGTGTAAPFPPGTITCSGDFGIAAQGFNS